MMRKLLASLAIAFFAAGCATAPSEGNGVGESADALAKASVSRGDTPSLTCPAAGTCQKADILCEDPESDPWCDILTRCFDCGWPGDYATAGEQESLTAGDEAAPQEARAGGEANLACPATGTCEKADVLCEDPETDVYWCNMLSRCVDCGWPGGYATADVTQ